MELRGGEGAGGSRSALVQAKGPKWRSMLDRMSRVDLFEGYEAEEDWVGGWVCVWGGGNRPDGHQKGVQRPKRANAASIILTSPHPHPKTFHKPSPQPAPSLPHTPSHSTQSPPPSTPQRPKPTPRTRPTPTHAIFSPFGIPQPALTYL